MTTGLGLGLGLGLGPRCYFILLLTGGLEMGDRRWEMGEKSCLAEEERGFCGGEENCIEEKRIAGVDR
jgi:hypothetical protein